MTVLQDTIRYIGGLLLVLVYPLLLGPGAGTVFLWSLKQKSRYAISLFWVLLIIAHGLGFLLVVLTLGGGLPGPGFFSCLVTPIFSVLTMLQLRIRGKQIQPGLDPRRTRWLQLGTILIPGLQILVILLLVLFGPALCETPLRSCDPF